MSLNTWVLGVFATVFALSNGVIDVVDALFIQSFVSMQLVEFFLWRAIDSGGSTRVASMAGLSLIAVQPVLSAARLLMPGQSPALGAALLAAYSLPCVLFALRAGPIVFETTVGSSGHLQWEWLRVDTLVVAAWAAVLIAPMLFLSPRWLNLSAAAFVLGTLLVSCYFGWRDGSWGTIWCWVAAAVSFKLIVQVFWKDVCVRSHLGLAE